MKATRVAAEADIRQRAFYALSQVYRAEKRTEDAKAALAQFTALKTQTDAQQTERFTALINKHEAKATPGPEPPTP